MKNDNGDLRAQPMAPEQLAAEIEVEILGHLRTCIGNLMRLANGVTVQSETDDGPTIYERPPDRLANEYILNRILGRPPTKKPLRELEPPSEQDLDLSKLPQERLDLMEKWLSEINGDSS